MTFRDGTEIALCGLDAKQQATQAFNDSRRQRQSTGDKVDDAIEWIRTLLNTSLCLTAPAADLAKEADAAAARASAAK